MYGEGALPKSYKHKFYVTPVISNNVSIVKLEEQGSFGCGHGNVPSFLQPVIRETQGCLNMKRLL